MDFHGRSHHGMSTPTTISRKDSSTPRHTCGAWDTHTCWASSETTSRTSLGSTWWDLSLKLISIGLTGLSTDSNAIVKRMKLMGCSQTIFLVLGIPRCFRTWLKSDLRWRLCRSTMSMKRLTIISWRIAKWLINRRLSPRSSFNNRCLQKCPPPCPLPQYLGSTNLKEASISWAKAIAHQSKKMSQRVWCRPTQHRPTASSSPRSKKGISMSTIAWAKKREKEERTTELLIYMPICCGKEYWQISLMSIYAHFLRWVWRWAKGRISSYCCSSGQSEARSPFPSRSWAGGDFSTSFLAHFFQFPWCRNWGVLESDGEPEMVPWVALVKMIVVLKTAFLLWVFYGWLHYPDVSTTLPLGGDWFIG